MNQLATQVYPAWRDEALNVLAYELWRAGAYRQAHESLEIYEWRVLYAQWGGRFAHKQEVFACPGGSSGCVEPSHAYQGKRGVIFHEK